MKEYYGKSVKEYFQTKGKRFLAMPALKRHLPKAVKGERFLDIGCGTGAYYPIASAKGYKYYGIDASEDMLHRAAAEHPQGGYIVARGNKFAKAFKGKFDAILISMVFPSLDSTSEMIAIMKECKKVLKQGRPLFIVVAHPSYDHYMQAGHLGRKNVQTQFAGYFASGVKYKTQRMAIGENKCFVYEDYHWTMDDYMQVIEKSGFCLAGLDECKPATELKHTDKTFYEKRSRWPSYLLLKAVLK